MSEEYYEFYRDPTTEECVIAVSKEIKGERPDGMVEGFAATFDRPNSSVSWTAIDPSMLGDRIPEDEAREVHPRLFQRLDQSEQALMATQKNQEREWIKAGDDPLRYEYGRENKNPLGPAIKDQLAYVEEEKYSSHFHWETYRSHEKGAKPSVKEAQEAAIRTLRENGNL